MGEAIGGIVGGLVGGGGGDKKDSGGGNIIGTIAKLALSLI